jgi:DNA replication protein DnaC
MNNIEVPRHGSGHTSSEDFAAVTGISPTRALNTFDNYKVTTPVQQDAVNKILQNPDSWFIMCGKTGTGKGHLAVALMHKKWQEGKRCCMINAKRLFLRIDDARNARESVEDVITGFASVDFLVINEIGRSTKSEAEINNLFEILDTRYEFNRQTILISNMTYEEMCDALFDEAFKRRIEEKSLPIAFSWESFE